MASIVRRPALVPVPINANTTPTHQKPLHGGKRSREDDPDDPTATRSSAKRVRLDVTAPSGPPNPSFDITACTPDSKVHLQDKSKDLGAPTKTADVAKDARSSKKSQVDKEKARAAKLEAEELFRQRYKAAFPHWRFYFDGVPVGAINASTRKIEQLGARIEHVLSNEVTHYITPIKIDKDKENESTHKKLSAPNALGTLRSPFDLKIGYDPVDRARKWGCKIWDIGKLESVLERTLARPAKPETPSTSTQSSLQGLLSLEKSTTASVKPAPVPLFKSNKASSSFTLGNAGQPRKLPPPFHSTASTSNSMRDRKLNPASRALVGLLKTEKATNTTMERDPKCQRHDYTYFGKLSAFLIIEAVNNDHQVVGRLEFKPKSTSSLSLSMTSRAMALDPRGAFHAAHRGASGKEFPEYPILHLDPRLRSPYQPFTARAAQKEVLLEHKERQDKTDRETLVRMFRAHKRAEREHTFRKAVSMSDLRAAAANVAHHTHAREESVDRASGFIHSTVGTGAYGSMASGSVASFSTAVTGSGYPPNTSRLSLSQSGGGDGHAKFFGAAGVVPSFGGVRNATQVVMNRGAFAESSAAGGSRSRTNSLTRTASLVGGASIRAEKPVDVTAGPGNGLRRTQSLATIKPKGAEAEKKKPEGYCECCKEQYDSLADHIKGKKHRKFASDPRRYQELDLFINRLARTSKHASRTAETLRAPLRAQARERYLQMALDKPRDFDVPASTTEADVSDERTMTATTSEEDPDKTFSSSLGLDQFFNPDTSFELSFFESGPATTNTSACISPVEESSLIMALCEAAGAAAQKEIIVISSNSSAVDSFDMALAGSSTRQQPIVASVTPRFSYKGTPMPFKRVFTAGCLDLSTDPASSSADGSPESEALADVLRRKKMHALVMAQTQTAQTSEREEDSDELEVIAV